MHSDPIVEASLSLAPSGGPRCVHGRMSELDSVRLGGGTGLGVVAIRGKMRRDALSGTNLARASAVARLRRPVSASGSRFEQLGTALSEKSRAGVNDTIAALQSDVGGLKQKLALVVPNLTRQQSHTERLEDQIARLHTDISGLRDQLAIASVFGSRVSQLEAEVSDLNAQLRSFAAPGQQSRPEIRRDERKRLKILEEVKQRLAAAEERLFAQEQIVAELQQGIDHAKVAREKALSQARGRYGIGEADNLPLELMQFHGAESWGGENRKCPGPEGKPPCTCTNRGCEESLADIRAFVRRFKLARPQYEHLHDDDLVAARIYTRDELFKKINTALRDDSTMEADLPPEEFKCVYYHLKNAVTHMEGVHESQMLFFRGQKKFHDSAEGQDDGHSYRVNETVTWKGFMSISTKREEAEKFAKGGVLFVIKNIQPNFGANLSGLSIFPNEDEILLPPGSSFRITKRSTDEDGTKVVTMEHAGLWADRPDLKLWDENLANSGTAAFRGEVKSIAELHVLVAEATAVKREMENLVRQARQENDGADPRPEAEAEPEPAPAPQPKPQPESTQPGPKLLETENLELQEPEVKLNEAIAFVEDRFETLVARVRNELERKMETVEAELKRVGGFEKKMETIEASVRTLEHSLTIQTDLMASVEEKLERRVGRVRNELERRMESAEAELVGVLEKRLGNIEASVRTLEPNLTMQIERSIERLRNNLTVKTDHSIDALRKDIDKRLKPVELKIRNLA